jgi:hypothetical protein
LKVVRRFATRLYAILCSKHLEPVPFGAIPLNKLRPYDIEALILAMRAKTKPPADAEPVRRCRIRPPDRCTPSCGRPWTALCVMG